MVDLLIKLFLRKNQSAAERRESIGRLAGLFGILGNVFLFAIKIVAGILAGSVSVIADAVNNLSDALSSAITVICFKLSGKPADEDHPYGHERIEYVATLILAFLIIFIGYELIKTSFGRIVNPQFSKLSLITVLILLVSVMGKLIMSKVYKDFAIMISSPVLKAASQDSLNDVFSTGAVLLTAVLGGVFKVSLDGYAGFIVSVFIIWSGISLVKEALNPILGSVPDSDLVCSIADKVQSYEGILGIHDLIVHSYGPNKTFASVHAEVDAKGDILASHDIIDNIERDIALETGVQLVIHMDPIVTDDEDVLRINEIVTEIVAKVDNSLSMHDFRMVTGHTHTNLIFDVVIPFDTKKSEKEINKSIQSDVFRTLGREYYCVINFDRNYTGM